MSSINAVPQNHVRLILLRSENSQFYLQIPTTIIASLCLKPRKYLVFLGWCILGVNGHLSFQPAGREIVTDGPLRERGIYHYVIPNDRELTTAVDPAVLERRTNVPSETARSRDNFRDKLLARDNCCVWTGITPQYGVGMHIMPFKLGSDRFRILVDNRPSYGEDVRGLNDINDIRNGVFSAMQIHTSFDLRHLVVLKTPNTILETGDIPQRHRRTLPQDTEYPRGRRYTLQWLQTSDSFVRAMVLNNRDAAFKTSTEEPKPSDLLLHYNYGAAAIKLWGHGIDVLRENTQHPHPPTPEEAPQKHNTAQTANDEGNAIAGLSRTTRRGQKCDADGVDGGNTKVEPGVEDTAEWDEDDVMLFLWSNTPAARERRRKKAEESSEYMERWREGVDQAAV